MTASMPDPPDFPDDDLVEALVSNDVLPPKILTAPAFQTRLCRMSAEEYHADPCPIPSLSSSIANVLITDSPLHAHTRHPRFGCIQRKDTKAFDRGTLSHALLLGAGKEIVIVDADDWKTKAAREARDTARATGKIAVLADLFEKAKDTADTLRQRFAELKDRNGKPAPIILDGESEVTALWTETAGGMPIQCRGMLDHLKLPTVYDLKSIRSADLVSCQKHIDAYGYDVQRSAYVSALEKIRPELAGRIDFIFIFYELEPPFAVTPVRLSGEFRELGERRWRRAVTIWERCLRLDEWPSYVDGIVDIDPPKWAMANDMERQLATREWLHDGQEMAQ